MSFTFAAITAIIILMFLYILFFFVVHFRLHSGANPLTRTSWMYPTVHVSTYQNITLEEPPLIIEGIIVHAGDRILVRRQDNPAENGIYEAVHEKLWVRASDFDHSRKIIPGALIHILNPGQLKESCWTFRIKSNKGIFPAIEFFPFLLDHPPGKQQQQQQGVLHWDDTHKCLTPAPTTTGEHWIKSEDTIRQYMYTQQPRRKLTSKNIISFS